MILSSLPKRDDSAKVGYVTTTKRSDTSASRNEAF